MVIMPLAYLPSVEWFAILAQNQRVIIEQFDNFTKQTMRNRCQILGPGGVQTLSVPVLGGRSSQKKKYRQILIDYSHQWIARHLNTIKTAYGSAPYFDYFFDVLQSVLKKRIERLFDLNLAIVKEILDFLEIKTQLSFTQEFISPSMQQSIDFQDFRNIIDKRHKSQVNFPPYPQVFEDKFGFVPNLSVIDLIFNLGMEARVYLQSLRI